MRECQEEIGVIYEPRDIQHEAFVMTKTVQGTKMHHFSLVENYAGTPEIRENKISDLRWFSIDDLPAPMVPHHRLALENMRKNIFYTEFNTAP